MEDNILKECKYELESYLMRESTHQELEEYLIFGSIGFHEDYKCICDNPQYFYEFFDDDNTGIISCNNCNSEKQLRGTYYKVCQKGYKNILNNEEIKIIRTNFNFLGMIDSKFEKYQESNQYRIDQFKEYLERKEKEIFTILFSDNSNISIDYKHRWTKSYQKGIIAKFHQLNAWFHRHNMKIGMLSLTTAQRNYSDREVLNRLLEGWTHLQDSLNKRGYLTFKLFEMHDTTGLPHLHVMIIGNLDINIIGEEIYYGEYKYNTIGFLWCNKHHMSDGIVGWDTKKQIYKDHSFDFSYTDNKDNNIVAYLMSYLRKNIVNEIINNPQAIRFHSLFWETKTRLFSASRYLSFVMKRFKFKSNNKVLFILCGNKEIYSQEKSTAYPCKYQQIEGLRYKYKLMPFEIKNKFNWKMPINIDSNYNISKMFRLWENEI